MQRRHLLSLISVGAFYPPLVYATSSPALWLASRYRVGAHLPDYWLSEKYDGIRGYWNGYQLLTRHGKPLTPPAWFTENWPQTPFEGELWAGRGQFEKAASVLQQKHAPDSAWRQLSFMVFDLPSHTGHFTDRITDYQVVVKSIGAPWVKAVEQTRCHTPEELARRLAYVVSAGAEGLMLHRAESYYEGGRSDDSMKVKPQDDAEAKVVGHVVGQGKHAQRLGALWVETPRGLRFKLGTGLKNSERETPPAIGQWVTYTYRGTTLNGTPRFASFVRIHPDIER